MRFPFDTTIERGDDELEIRVIYDVTPFIDATYWQPAEGGEVEVISVTHDGKPIVLSDAEESALLEKCRDRCGDDMEQEAAAAADWKYQEHRDRLMMEKWERDE